MGLNSTLASEDWFKKRSANFKCFLESEPRACTLWALCSQPLLQLCAGAEERYGRTGRCRCTPAVSEIIPYDGIDWSRIAQRLPTLGGADFDPASASAAGRLYECICTKHAGSAESINCTDGVKPVPAELYAVFCLFPGEWVSIKDDVCRRIAAHQVECL